MRLRLSRWLVLALEFQVAADILYTAVAPTWDEIGQLAAVIVLRTVLNFFLQIEIERSVPKKSPDTPVGAEHRKDAGSIRTIVAVGLHRCAHSTSVENYRVVVEVVEEIQQLNWDLKRMFTFAS